jgi:hypothetical protein
MFGEGTLMEPPAAKGNPSVSYLSNIMANQGVELVFPGGDYLGNPIASTVAKQNVYDSLAAPFMGGVAQQCIGRGISGEAAASGDAGATAVSSAR